MSADALARTGAVPALIIRPELQPRGQRLLFRLITTLAWTLWLYMMMPVVAVMGWLIGIDLFRRYVLDVDTASFVRISSAYAIVIPAAALLILAWSEFNIRRFRRKFIDRRRAASVVTPEMMCERFEIDRATLDLLNTGRLLTMDIDEHERVRHVGEGPLPPRSIAAPR